MESSAINCDDEEKWEAEEEEEEEEALSLCDLPVNLNKEGNQIQQRNEEDGESQAIKTEEDFNFGSLGGRSLSIEPEMCAADEVFFKGQILPFRLSVGSDSGLTGCQQDSQNNSGCLSRPESMDYGSLSRFTSGSSSSRSSSTKSSHHCSTNSSNSSTVIASNSSSNSKPKPIKIRNNFNTHPSPKPQIRSSKIWRPAHVSSRNQISSIWDFFRLGLVRAPELELQDLKLRTNNNNNNNANRNSVSRNGSCNSSKSGGNKIVNVDQVAKNQQDSNKGFLEKRMGLFNGCKCTFDAVETVPLNNIVVIKSTTKHSEKETSTLHAAMEEQKRVQLEVKIKKKMKEKPEAKQAFSRNRTFEWLKELSHASYVDEA